MILIVENDIALAKLIKKKLKEDGYEVIIANSGAKALELLDDHAPSIILLDYSLYDINAKELINNLYRRDQPLPPFIISTGHGDERIAIAIMKLNAKDYIIKDDEYLENISKAIDRVAKEIENERKLKQVEIELRESEKKYRYLSNQLETILDHIPGLVFYKDKQNNYISLNKRTAQIHGKDKNSLIGKNISELYPKEQADRYFQEDLQVIKTGTAILNIEEPMETPDGVEWHNMTKVPFKDDNGSIVGVLGIAMDITERKRAEEEIKMLVHQLEIAKKNAEQNAMTDSLTTLPNRRYFDETLNLEFLRLHRSQEPLSLIMIDIDYFKKFNDRYGHIAGDNCLKEVALAIKSELKRSSDVVARYGGEEFVVILPNNNSRGATSIAENIRKSIENRSIPHLDSDFSKNVTISLGVATIIPSDLNTSELLLRMADTALYQAKEKGRNRVEVAIGECNFA